jgi:hypothetical protein
LALGVDETGKCRETIKQICVGTGYSHTEVINTLRELDTLGYLSIVKDTKGNVYTPSFVARGALKPSENVVKKVDSTPLDSVESSPQEEKSPSSIKSIKELNTTKEKKFDVMDGILKSHEQAEEARNKGIAWKGRDAFPESHRKLADEAVRKFGSPSPRHISLWILEIGDWYSNGCTVADFRCAEEITKTYSTPVVTITGMTSAIKTCAQTRKQKIDDALQPKQQDDVAWKAKVKLR